MQIISTSIWIFALMVYMEPQILKVWEQDCFAGYIFLLTVEISHESQNPLPFKASHDLQPDVFLGVALPTYLRLNAITDPLTTLVLPGLSRIVPSFHQRGPSIEPGDSGGRSRAGIDRLMITQLSQKVEIFAMISPRLHYEWENWWDDKPIHFPFSLPWDISFIMQCKNFCS